MGQENHTSGTVTSLETCRLTRPGTGDAHTGCLGKAVAARPPQCEVTVCPFEVKRCFIGRSQKISLGKYPIFHQTLTPHFGIYDV